MDWAGKFEVEIDGLRKQLPADVRFAHQEGVAAGRAERDDEVTALQQIVERMTKDPDAANRDREHLVAKVKDLTDHRDDLQQRLTELQPTKVSPPRPRGPGQY